MAPWSDGKFALLMGWTMSVLVRTTAMYFPAHGDVGRIRGRLVTEVRSDADRRALRRWQAHEQQRRDKVFVADGWFDDRPAEPKRPHLNFDHDVFAFQRAFPLTLEMQKMDRWHSTIVHVSKSELEGSVEAWVMRRHRFSSLAKGPSVVDVNAPCRSHRRGGPRRLDLKSNVSSFADQTSTEGIRFNIGIPRRRPGDSR